MDAAVMRGLLARFEAKRASLAWAGHEGEFVVIAEVGEIGFFRTDEEARRLGMQAFGVCPLLVKRVERAPESHKPAGQ
jgi:hypothetical protein